MNASDRQARMIVRLASSNTPRSGEVTTAALSKGCLPARRIAGRFLRSKVRDRQMRIRALERSCPAILPMATDLSSYISVTVPPHRRECAVHSSQERRLIFPESNPERLRVVGNLRHDAPIGPFRRQRRRHRSDHHHGCDAPPQQDPSSPLRSGRVTPPGYVPFRVTWAKGGT